MFRATQEIVLLRSTVQPCRDSIDGWPAASAMRYIFERQSNDFEGNRNDLDNAYYIVGIYSIRYFLWSKFENENPEIRCFSWIFDKILFVTPKGFPKPAHWPG